MDVKQVLVVRKDLNMRKGKIAAQCAHASMKVILDKCTKMESGDSFYMKFFVRKESALDAWLNGSFKKIVVSVDSEEELMAVYDQARNQKLPCSLIVDSGLTEFNGVPTKTVVAIGPCWSESIDEITGHLKLM